MSKITERLVCLQCGNNINRGAKFCCRSCAAKYNNKYRVRIKGKTKPVICPKCNKTFEISISATNGTHICKNCRKKLRLKNFCIYNTSNEQHIKDCTNCFFFLNKICTARKSGIVQIFNNLRSVKIFNFDDSVIGTEKIVDEFLRIKNLLYHLYYDVKLSGLEIDKLAGKHIWQSIGKRIFHLKSRTFSEANMVAVEQYRLIHSVENQYKSEWHKTWDNREVFLRSGYETDYANQLDEQKIYYDVENLRIKYFDSQQNKYRCAVPNFYIPSTNTIIEIKSTWTYDEQNMKDKFRAYQEQGYNTKLILEHKEMSL